MEISVYRAQLFRKKNFIVTNDYIRDIKQTTYI